jgi:hypothetical protein
MEQGFLKLAMARRHLPAHALGELSFHEAFDAVTVVSAPIGAHDSWQIVRAGGPEQPQAPEASATLTHRKKTAQRTDESASGSQHEETGAQSTRDTILWFSSLPPNDLRQAQKLFASSASSRLRILPSRFQQQQSPNGAVGGGICRSPSSARLCCIRA